MRRNSCNVILVGFYWNSNFLDTFSTNAQISNFNFLDTFSTNAQISNFNFLDTFSTNAQIPNFNFLDTFSTNAQISNFNFLDTFFTNAQISNFIKILPARDFHAGGRTEGQTDGLRDSNSRVSQFSEGTQKKRGLYWHILAVVFYYPYDRHVRPLNCTWDDNTRGH